MRMMEIQNYKNEPMSDVINADVKRQCECLAAHACYPLSVRECNCLTSDGEFGIKIHSGPIMKGYINVASVDLSGLELARDLRSRAFLPLFSDYPGLRPRSLVPGAGSGRGSERSRSIGTDFDDSKTYRVIYSCDSRCSEEYGIQSKKDDIRHFHEHHHFFHDKSEEKSEATRPPCKIWETFPCGKKCFLNYSARVSRTARPTTRDATRRGRGGSGSSSRSERKSSDNETHPMPCKRCQKFLKEYPDARIVRPSKKGRQEHADPQSPIDVMQADVIVAESLSEMEKISLSWEKECSKKREKTCKVDSEGPKDAIVKKLRSDGKSCIQKLESCVAFLKQFTFLPVKQGTRGKSGTKRRRVGNRKLGIPLASPSSSSAIAATA